MKNKIVFFSFLLAFLATGTIIVSAATVVVPGNATGGFGNPPVGYVPLIPALKVYAKGTIIISYISGTITDSGGVNAGPNGATYVLAPWDQMPLQEVVGTMAGTVPNLNALIGAFVPASTVKINGFAAVDGTKALAPVGIPVNALFFVGTYATVDVNGPGTLFLGINDGYVGDNGGSFTVKVSFIQNPSPNYVPANEIPLSEINSMP
ncbi:MAG: hypothetical protein QG657_2697 [Acidobacteriota bacterium]|nr:hypothetical protein [Acidobacteriota bacterium]